jgi:hypothetical protein
MLSICSLLTQAENVEMSSNELTKFKQLANKNTYSLHYMQLYR